MVTVFRSTEATPNFGGDMRGGVGGRVLLPAERGDLNPPGHSPKTSHSSSERFHHSQPWTPFMPCLNLARSSSPLTPLPEGPPGPDLTFLETQEGCRVLAGVGILQPAACLVSKVLLKQATVPCLFTQAMAVFSINGRVEQLPQRPHGLQSLKGFFCQVTWLWTEAVCPSGAGDDIQVMAPGKSGI